MGQAGALAPDAMRTLLMTTPEPSQRSKTADEILDLAETLIQTSGYSAFSYQDISDALGITGTPYLFHL